MGKCKEDCKVYEKKEVEHVEKDKHLKQKLKKFEDKIEKVCLFSFYSFWNFK